MSKTPGKYTNPNNTISKNALIPRPFIDELLTRTHLVDLIGAYIPLKKQGNSFVACCPFHNEKTPSFNVIEKKQFYHCFGCGANGNAISFVMDYLNQGFVDAINTLASRLGMQVPREDNASSEEMKAVFQAHHLLQEITRYYQKTLKEKGIDAITYLRERGVSGEIAKRFQLGFALNDWHALETRFKNHKPELISTGMLVQHSQSQSQGNAKTYDRYRNRIIFPIHDRQGRVIGFGGRAIQKDQKPKYLNSPETKFFQKNRELYGLHQVLQKNKGDRSGTVLLVEGYLDVIALAQHGIDNAVATLGTATSSYHMHILSRYFNQLIFCFDGDIAGKKAALRALENSLPFLDNFLDLRFMFLPEEHDPDSFVRKEGQQVFLSQMEKAIPLDKYLLDSLKTGIDIQSLAGKNRLINKAKPLLASMPEGSYKQLILQELAEITHIENHRLQQMLSVKNDKTSQNNQNNKAPPSTKLSAMRYAMALLLQNPSIYTQCKNNIHLDSLDGKGQEILRNIFAMIDKNPEITTASLVELWRDSPLFDFLGKLAGRNLIIPKEGMIKEFMDTIGLLNKQNLEEKIKHYLNMLEKQGLSPSEKLLLKDLLQKKHEIA